MSGLLAGKVWQSDLDPELKPLAAALADIANDDGSRIYPSVDYMSWLLGRSRRQIQRSLLEMKKLGVLLPISSTNGGRHKPTEYLLIESALPRRQSWSERFRDRGPSLSPEQRARIFLRDGAACKLCGSINDLTIDHNVPRSSGGTDGDDNLQVLCRPCNSAKGVNSVTVTLFRDRKSDICVPETVTSTHQTVTPVSHDPSVDPLETRGNVRAARGNGYKTNPKPAEEKWFYPPADFPITEILYLWLAEMCFAFTDTELADATNAWRESRASKPNHLKRTLGMWQADWQKFIRAYWQIRQRDKAWSNGNSKHNQEYTGPVKSVPDPVKENCQACRGLGTVYRKINGVEYAEACKHQAVGVVAA